MKEIERSFLLTSVDLPLRLKNVVEIRQMYFGAAPVSRIRQSDLIDPVSELLLNTSYCYTMKLPDVESKSKGVSRFEFEVPLSYEEFQRLKSQVVGLPITKTMRIYDWHGHELQVSVLDEGLPTERIYGEVEFTSEEEANRLDITKIPGFVKEITSESTMRVPDFWYNTRVALSDIAKMICSHIGVYPGSWWKNPNNNGYIKLVSYNGSLHVVACTEIGTLIDGSAPVVINSFAELSDYINTDVNVQHTSSVNIYKKDELGLMR